MHIQIIAVGKIKEKFLTLGIAEYTKRLAPYIKFVITEVADEKAPDALSEKEEIMVREKEGERILAQLRPDAYAIALTLDGNTWSSEQLAHELAELATYGRSHIVFIIGGSTGLAPSVLARVQQRLSFGRMTLPHQLMRLVLTEQVYRAVTINQGMKYHK